MNILSISSILPIPDIIKHNDFVFQTYKNYNQLYANDKIVIIKPVKYDFNLVRIIRGTANLFRLKRRYSRNINNFQVEIFPFFSFWSWRNIHAILTSSIYFLNRKRINSLFSFHKFEVIHAQYIFPDGLLAYLLSKKYKIPYYLTTHNERFYFNHFISRKTTLRIMKKAFKVLPINHTNYLYFKSIGVKNIEMIPLGFNKSFIREQKSLSRKCLSIFTAAELIKLKNIDRVLQAIKMLVPSYDLHYTIIGTGPERGFLLKLTDELTLNNYVSFVDHIPHESIADEMYKHDIFIMPSYFETFGRVFFEAMAMGIPIVCAKNSGIYGIFKDGEEGISVDHNNIKDIANAIEYLILHPEERLRIGRNGQKLVQNFTWEYVAEKLHCLYANSERSNHKPSFSYKDISQNE